MRRTIKKEQEQILGMVVDGEGMTAEEGLHSGAPMQQQPPASAQGCLEGMHRLNAWRSHLNHMEAMQMHVDIDNNVARDKLKGEMRPW